MTKITITGVPPQFDQSYLEQLQDQKVKTYLKTTQSKYNLRANLPNKLLEQFAVLVGEGYSLSELPVNMAPGNYQAYLIKPDHLLGPEVEAIKAQVKAEYVAHLESEHDRYKQLLIQQLVEAKEEKEAKEAARRKEEQLTEFRKQADECYKPLKIPE